ncbi:hypothetical protein CRUP_036069, partial [Coryphaenoides rupestris]
MGEDGGGKRGEKGHDTTSNSSNKHRAFLDASSCDVDGDGDGFSRKASSTFSPLEERNRPGTDGKQTSIPQSPNPRGLLVLLVRGGTAAAAAAAAAELMTGERFNNRQIRWGRQKTAQIFRSCSMESSNERVTARKRSWPAVSQICSLIFWPLTSMMRVPNSTPM